MRVLSSFEFCSSIQCLFGWSAGDEELLESLEASGQWDEGRTWARQLDSGGQRTCSALHHVTETQVVSKKFLHSKFHKSTM